MTRAAASRRSRDAFAALLVALAAAGPVPVGAQTTPPDPAAAQPSLPKPLDNAVPLSSSVLGGGGKGSERMGGEGMGGKAGAVRHPASRRAGHSPAVRHRRYARAPAEPLERPALAGVELVAPLPVPVQPPHFTVPTPAYLPENAATFFTTPLPPVICHRVPRDPAAPDPHLLRETTVLCEADNP